MTKHKRKLFIGGTRDGMTRLVPLDRGRLKPELMFAIPPKIMGVFTYDIDPFGLDLPELEKYYLMRFFLESESGRFAFSAYVKSGIGYSEALPIVQTVLEETGLL